jgi:RimJ/RimL family protein N-acetyltransferase
MNRAVLELWLLLRWHRGSRDPAPVSSVMTGGMMPLDSDQLPTFTTARLTLRPRTLKDLEACLAMDRDPLVTKFIHGPWADPVAHRAFVEARVRHVYPAGMGYWSIFASARFIGWILLTPLDLLGPDTEIGWRLVRAAWGRGYATEAARPVLDHALHTLGLRRVVADIDPINTASISVARKLRLVADGTVPCGERTVIRYIAGITGMRA